VIVERVLRQASEPIHVETVLGEKARQEIGVSPPIGEVRKPEVPPGVDVPIAVAVIDDLDRSSVQLGEVDVALPARAAFLAQFAL
jgi:hypothetical protein